LITTIYGSIYNTRQDRFNYQGVAWSIPFAGLTTNTLATDQLILPPLEPAIASHNLMVGLFQVLQYIPLALINTLSIELYCESNANALCDTGPSATTNQLAYNVSNLKLYYDEIHFEDSFLTGLVETIADNGEIYIPFYQIKNHIRNFPLNVANWTFEINERVTSLDQCFVVPIPNQLRENFAEPSVSSFTPWCNLNYYWFRLNSIYHPIYPIKTITEQFAWNQISTNQFGDLDGGGFINRENGSSLSSSNPLAFNFCEFYSFDFEREKCPSLLSGYDTEKAMTNLEFIFSCWSNTTAFVSTNSDKTFFFYLVYDATLGIGPNGSVRVYK
jgi:hypothetical protein